MDRSPLLIGYIYLVTNLVNGKKYVGYTTKRVEDRWCEHKSAAKGGSPLLFHRSIRKYGPLSFHTECIRTITGTHNDIVTAEIEAIAIHDCMVPKGYNLTHGGDGVDFSVPGVRERHITAQRKKTEDPVWKQRNSEQLRQQHADPAWKQANAEGLQRAWEAHRAKAVARDAHLPLEEQVRRARRREQDRKAKAAKRASSQEVSP